MTDYKERTKNYILKISQALLCLYPDIKEPILWAPPLIVRKKNDVTIVNIQNDEKFIIGVIITNGKTQLLCLNKEKYGQTPLDPDTDKNFQTEFNFLCELGRELHTDVGFYEFLYNTGKINKQLSEYN